MEVSLKDREILRELATRKAALATSARNDEILKMWDNQANGVRDTPTVRLLFSKFPGEVIEPRMICDGNMARNIEKKLLWSMVGRELFDDDTPVSSTFDVNMFAKVSPFGTPPNIIRAKDSIGYKNIPSLRGDWRCRLTGRFFLPLSLRQGGIRQDASRRRRCRLAILPYFR